MPGVLWATAAGGLRRGEDFVDRLHIVAAAENPEAAAASLSQTDGLPRAAVTGAGRVSITSGGQQIDLTFEVEQVAGATLFLQTGSEAHIRGLRALGSIPDLAPSEEHVYRALRLPWIPAEIRDGADEIAAASQGRLPVLVSRSDIRGDLHMHTDWSDGRDSLEDMIGACAHLGYEYIAITDHSVTAAASRTLTREAIPRQAAAIAELRERYPGMAILHGCEADILADGRLDFDDDVLENFDIVLASLHDGAGLPPEQLLERYSAAMRHPLVTVITHPVNRLVGGRPGYDIDYRRLFDIAAETSTAVEIDGSPSHLDLDGPRARQAVSQGAMVAIDSDCHMSDLLGRQMDLGLRLARRGWVEPRHVLNARPLAELRRLISEKRGR
jgi:DNA polymerase (family 10)